MKRKSSTKSYKDIIENAKEVIALYDGDKVKEIEDYYKKHILGSVYDEDKVDYSNPLDSVWDFFAVGPLSIDTSKFNETEKSHLHAVYGQLIEADECYRLRHKDLYPKADIGLRWSNKAKDLVPYKKAPPKSCKTKKNKLRNNSRNKTRK